MQIYDSEHEYSQAVRSYLVNHQHLEFLIQILEDPLCRNRRIFLFGGTVRDALIKYIYNEDIISKDFDLMFDNSNEDIDFDLLMLGEEHLTKNCFGNTKWSPFPGFDLDLTNLQCTINGIQFKNLEERLFFLDLTTSSLAFDLTNNILYDVSAVDGIKSKEVDIQNNYLDAPVRVLYHSIKLGFTLGPKAVKLLKSINISEIEPSIDKYLTRKNLTQYRERVLQLYQGLK